MTKLRLLLFGFLAIFCIIVVRLFYIQVLHPDLQHDYLSTRKLQPERGKIFDRNGEPIVMNQILYHLFFEPQLIQNKEKTASTIADILKVSDASIAARIDPTKTWTSVLGSISQQNKNAILKLIPKKHFDIIYTHNPSGEYTRHIRHEETGKAVIKLWRTGKISTDELRTFAYEDGNKKYYPKPVENATIYRALTKQVWLNKYSIITETYGFEKNSWEAETTPRVESFRQFKDSYDAIKWLNKIGVIT